MVISHTLGKIESAMETLPSSHSVRKNREVVYLNYIPTVYKANVMIVYCFSK